MVASPSVTHHEPADKRAGMIFMCIAMGLLPVGDAISKSLTSVLPAFEVTVLRASAQAAFFLPVAFLLRRHMAGPVFTRASLISAVLIATVTYTLVTAFSVMPIATAIAIFFLEPLVLTVLAGVLLGEVPGPRRFAAVGVGLIGAMIVIRPNFSEFGPVVLLPLVGAVAYALNMIVLRKATARQSALSFQFGASLFAAGLLVLAETARVIFGARMPGVWAMPEWVVLAVISAGALATVTFLMITFAFSKVEASILAPFQYLEIVGATAVGFLVFGDFPDAITLFGTSIILASGAYVFHRERKRDIELASSQPPER
ncbi:DMT family transporter [Roseivivax sediminis]|uniref:Threonine/homoserine efflux transporter RhtA n=1 Tax=Roseivivax sediminis TaxID=936889 RepID=A0A1I1V9G3_9RHOB|nr:DMT family transporter [Roseivivax sediminis]SFD79646.1 Threonine/homoserine efflux transporter RhtA [Roseivivax sediminis]